MEKYRIIIAVIAACLALCAAVRPRTEAVEETRPNPSDRCKRARANH